MVHPFLLVLACATRSSPIEAAPTDEASGICAFLASNGACRPEAVLHRDGDDTPLHMTGEGRVVLGPAALAVVGVTACSELRASLPRRASGACCLRSVRGSAPVPAGGWGAGGSGPRVSLAVASTRGGCAVHLAAEEIARALDPLGHCSEPPGTRLVGSTLRVPVEIGTDEDPVRAEVDVTWTPVACGW